MALSVIGALAAAAGAAAIFDGGLERRLGRRAFVLEALAVVAGVEACAAGVVLALAGVL
ncbi:hypothetical protein [Enterorhabdus sp. P55]|jgi:hypothetical protein|uniref:hypothetical protein n=1 Tax=Enterorhabdus sp. P55 TaxID=2304571 RepID=UPI0013707517|nr:hypothetical protein [Enterorhabdus sp. P55]MCI8452643.1 hypothetical protein [Eggerthellaceae bacterium]